MNTKLFWCSWMQKVCLLAFICSFRPVESFPFRLFSHPSRLARQSVRRFDCQLDAEANRQTHADRRIDRQTGRQVNGTDKASALHAG